MLRSWLRAIGSPSPEQRLGDGIAAYQRGDDATALRILRPLAEAGEPEAQYLVGRLYQQGRGVAQDEAEAIRWYRKAAEREHPGAQFELGRAYDEGVIVPQDDAEAARWYEQAARRGHSEAQCRLGTMYMTGRGVAADPIEAYAWLTIAQNEASDSGRQASARRSELVRTMTPAQTEAAERRRAEITAGIR